MGGGGGRLRRVGLSHNLLHMHMRTSSQEEEEQEEGEGRGWGGRWEG